MDRLRDATFGSVACLILFAGQPASANFIQSTSADAAGFTTSTTIGFDEFGLSPQTVLTDQYAPLGVEFSPRLIQDAQNCFGFSGFSGNCAGDLEPAGPFVDILFGSVQQQAGLHMVFLVAVATFEAYLGNELVSSGAAATTLGPNNFFGFSGVAFDRIRINQGGNTFIMDNLTLDVVSVPVPPTLALMSLGVAALGFRRPGRLLAVQERTRGYRGRPPAEGPSPVAEGQSLDTAVACTATTCRCSGDEACPACAYWRARAGSSRDAG